MKHAQDNIGWQSWIRKKKKKKKKKKGTLEQIARQYGRSKSKIKRQSGQGSGKRLIIWQGNFEKGKRG